MKTEVYLLSSGTLHSDEVNIIFTLKVGNPDSVWWKETVLLSVAAFFRELQQAALAGI